MNRSASHINPGLGLAWAFACASLAGCGGKTDPPATTVDFPTSRPDQADHCSVVLQLRLGQLDDATGKGWLSEKIDQSIAKDYEPALQAASLEVARSRGVLRPFEEVQALVVRTRKSFDQDGDGSVSPPGEIAEFDRHVDLCVEKFGSP